MRAIIASVSNDHRLGANEAPPAIISVYLGSQLEGVFNQIHAGELKTSALGRLVSLGIGTLPEFPKDPGDRSRTSPFAFTGSRFKFFEFRAVGLAQPAAGLLIALNTFLFGSIGWVADELESRLQSGASVDGTAFETIKQIMNEHGAVIFGGDVYSAEWASHSRGGEPPGAPSHRCGSPPPCSPGPRSETSSIGWAFSTPSSWRVASRSTASSTCFPPRWKPRCCCA